MSINKRQSHLAEDTASGSWRLTNLIGSSKCCTTIYPASLMAPVSRALKNKHQAVSHGLMRSFPTPWRGSIGNPVRIRNGPAAVSGDETRNHVTGSCLEVVSEPRITPEGQAQADSKAQQPRQSVSISRGLQRRHWASDGVMEPLPGPGRRGE